MSLYQEARQMIINEMVDRGELIRKGEDHYEDMGGHMLHDSWLDDYIANFLKNLPTYELKELMNRFKGDL